MSVVSEGDGSGEADGVGDADSEGELDGKTDGELDGVADGESEGEVTAVVFEDADCVPLAGVVELLAGSDVPHPVNKHIHKIIETSLFIWD